MHRLLQRQLRKLGLGSGSAPAEWQRFVQNVDAVYAAFDGARRKLELSSRELLAANSDRRASEEVLRNTLEATADGVLAIGGRGSVLYVNDRYFELLDLPREVFEISDMDQRLAAVAARLIDPQPFLDKMRAVRSSGVTETFDILYLKSGRVVERSSRPFQVLDGPVGRVWSYRDITQSYMLEEQLRHQAFHDPLTGLANRARFADRLELALDRGRRSRSPVFVLYLDIDDFKAINDSLGHTLGDETLRAVADRLRDSLRPGDTPARLGGDEFALLLEDLLDVGAAQLVAEGLLSTIRAPLILDGHEITMDASIGVVESSFPATPEEILRNADIAMYAAKKQGKGRVQAYVSGMHSRVRERQQLTAELRHAIERNEIRVLYQPTVFLEDCSSAGAEALVRWDHPRRGLMSPDDFVPIAEESGLIGAIGEYVLMDACRLLAEWQGNPETRSLEINVNVSAKQVRDPDFVDCVRRAILETGILPGGLTLEITESAMIEDPERCLETLTFLKRMGVQLALDDFGTGYSSLSYLKRFPIDILKIDKSFIGDLYQSERETLLTSATIAFGKNLSLKIFAEGIETEEQLQHLRDLECEFGQGFLFSPPLSRDAIDLYVCEGAHRRAA